MSAAITPLIGEPARRPPTYPAIIGPAGWIHQSRNERIRMTREEDQNENGGPSRSKGPASLSASQPDNPRVEGCGVGGARRNKVFVAAATRPRGLVDREAHLTLDDDPPLRAVAVLRDRRILSGLEQGRGTGPPLEQPQRHAVQRRLGLRKLSDEVRESRHGWGNGLGGLKVAIMPPAKPRISERRPTRRDCGIAPSSRPRRADAIRNRNRTWRRRFGSSRPEAGSPPR